MPDNRERRLKIYTMSRHVLLAVLNGLPNDVHCLPIHGEIPEGAEVIDVRDDWSRQCLTLIVFHESFPIVPDGNELEIVMDLGRHLVKRPVEATHELVEQAALL